MLLFVYLAWPGSLKERQKVVYCLFIWQGQKVQKKGKKGFIVCLSGRARKLKKKGKRLFIVCLSSRAGKVKRGQKLLIVYSSCRAGKFKRKAKSCLLIVYATGKKFKRRKKVVYCLFIRQFKRGNMLLIGYLSVRARKLKEKQKSCLLFVYRAGTGSLKERQERQKFLFVLFIQQGQEVKKKGKKWFIVLSGRARKLKRKAEDCLLLVYPAGDGRLKEAKSC